MRTGSRLALAVSLLGICAVSNADAPAPAAPIEIHRRTGAITVDGRLDDPGWQDAAKIGRFYEGNPGDNTTPKVKTAVYLTYDDKNFYIGVRCEDPDPKKIRAPYVERDAVLGTDDNIAILLDTRNDKRTAMELRVNARGIQGDAMIDDTNGNEDFSPDFFYDTAASIDAGGWSAEYRIPLSSLRYPKANPQKWNILVWRNYPREYRYGIYSAPVPRGSNCLVCHAVPIVGLTELPDSGHLVAAPYVTSERLALPEGELGTPLANQPLHTTEGLDVKWTPTATNAVDATINPDFSQIESDVAQITVNQRFAVFYPEKRPFFLEGLDLFDIPMQVVYTRTITSPRFGVRNTGKVGGTAYTVLVTEDRGGGLTVIPGAISSEFAPQDFKSTDVIARVRHDLGTSFVGAVFTDREIRGGGHNRVLGPDFQWRPNPDADSITGEVLVSDNANPNLPGVAPMWDGARTTSHAADLAWFHQTRNNDWSAELKEIGDKFRADLGFLPQVGYREADGSFGWRFYPEHGLLSFVRPSLFVDQQSDTANRTIFRRISPGINAQGRKNLVVFAALRTDYVRVGSQLLRETYLTWQTQIDPSHRFTRITFNGNAGQMIDFANGRVGHGASLVLAPTIRPFDRLTFDGELNREWLDVSGGRLYTATVERLKTTYSFSAKSLVRVIGQYVKTNRNRPLYSFDVPAHDGDFAGSILYSYKLNWQTVLFVGYGDDRVLTPANDLVRADRSFFFKVSYALQM